MAYCKYCGKPLEEGVKFCSYCGRQVAEDAAPPQYGAYPPPPGTPAGEPYAPSPIPEPPGSPPGGAYSAPEGAAPEGTYPPGVWSPPPAKSSRKWIWISAAAVVVIAAVACVLVFVVFDGGDDGQTAGAGTVQGGTATTISATDSGDAATDGTGGGEVFTSAPGTPEQAVKRFFEAMQNKDIDTIFSLTDPAALEGLPTGAALEELKDQMRDDLFDFQSIEISGLKMSTEMTGDTTATVTLTAGTATITDMDGEKTVERIEDESEPVTVDLVNKNGSWYLLSSPVL